MEYNFISGYHIREAGSNAIEELALLFQCNRFIEHAVDRGLNIDDFCSRISFFFNGHNYFLKK